MLSDPFMPDPFMPRMLPPPSSPFCPLPSPLPRLRGKQRSGFVVGRLNRPVNQGCVRKPGWTRILKAWLESRAPQAGLVLENRGRFSTWPRCSSLTGTAPLARRVSPDGKAARAAPHPGFRTHPNPTALFEGLSVSTEAYDCGLKADCFRRIPGLRAYALLSQHTPHIELYERVDSQ